MSHYGSAQVATTTSFILGNLVDLKICNPRALGKQEPPYQAGIGIVKCTELGASQEMLFIQHPYGNITLHSCCLTIFLPFHQNLGPSFVFQITPGYRSCYSSTGA